MTALRTEREPVVRVRGLRRVYGRGAQAFEAVRGLDLDVATTALLGTHGAAIAGGQDEQASASTPF